jgi:diguanylate cyclase (GGDEF)-like protein/PAS domain S-box-containing protein
LGQAIEVIYTAKDGQKYYINRYERLVSNIDGSKEAFYQDASTCDIFEVDGQEIILFVQQSEIDAFVKEEIRNYLHSEVYSGNQYVWVNEVLNMDGGTDYAVRRIHPNLIESEGEFLSTSMMDMKGNYPYLVELEGIRENGYVFHSYYFKNIVNDEITEKYSYAQYYEPFKWIIATGETIEEVYAFSEQINAKSFQQIFVLMAMFAGLFLVTSGLMIRSLGNQSENFKETLMKQAEVYENIYNSMATGLLRIRMTEDTSSILQINPKGLETLGVDTEEELLNKIHGHKIETMLLEDAQKLEKSCKDLTEQWESIVTECHIEWKDGSIRLIRIRDTLVDFEGEEKIIQRMCQDITEERFQHEQAIQAAEEKATLDPMTQLKNKKAIEMIIRNQIMEAAETMTPIAIGFVDIDNFRDYNTKYGHLQGDEVIKYVANTVKEAVPGIVGRNGGDEFAFVISNATYEMVDEAMQKIHKKLNEGLFIKDIGEKAPTPCSIGVIIEKSHSLDYDYAMEQSDAAMYEAKAKGKNTYHILNHVV